MAVRALKNRTAPKLPKAGNRQHFVDHARAEQYALRSYAAGAGCKRQFKCALGTGKCGNLHRFTFDVGIRSKLLTRNASKVCWGSTITRDKVVHLNGTGVARFASIAQQHAFARTP